MALRGVRISWLILARNCDFALLALSASSLAKIRSRSASFLISISCRRCCVLSLIFPSRAWLSFASAFWEVANSWFNFMACSYKIELAIEIAAWEAITRNTSSPPSVNIPVIWLLEMYNTPIRSFCLIRGNNNKEPFVLASVNSEPI